MFPTDPNALPTTPSNALPTPFPSGFQRPSDAVPTPFQRGALPTPQTPQRACARAWVRAHARGAEVFGHENDGAFRGHDNEDFGSLKVAQTSRLAAVDIGRTGAVALFVDRELIDVVDMPTLADGPACRPTVNAALLGILLGRLAPTEAVVEHVSARPGEASPGAFAFGRSRGVIEGVLGAQAIPVRFVTPAWWKRRAGIPAGRDQKDTARSVAIARWPQHAALFARAKDHDRAEACLIGLAYLKEHR